MFFDLPKNGISGLADGMTVDANNNLWVAVHAGGKVSTIKQRDFKYFTCGIIN